MNMKERTKISGSPACIEWEALLADALDGLLGPEDEAKFAAHRALCPACAAMYDEARKGREWLKFLSPELEVPAGLVDKILAATGPETRNHWEAAPLPAGVVPAFVPPVWQQPGIMARLRAVMQPRLMMTAAMAFFSIAFTLNVTGLRSADIHLADIHPTSLRLSDLRPRTVRAYMERQLATASVPIVRYYDHLRVVNEVQARVRELRSQTGGESQPNQAQPTTPGETRKNSARRPGGKEGRFAPGQLIARPVIEPPATPINDIQESSLEIPRGSSAAVQAEKRSTSWIA